MPYHNMPYRPIPYHITTYHTLTYHTIPYHAVPYRTMPYCTIPYHTIPYHTIPCVCSYPHANGSANMNSHLRARPRHSVVTVTAPSSKFSSTRAVSGCSSVQSGPLAADPDLIAILKGKLMILIDEPHSKNAHSVILRGRYSVTGVRVITEGGRTARGGRSMILPTPSTASWRPRNTKVVVVYLVGRYLGGAKEANLQFSQSTQQRPQQF